MAANAPASSVATTSKAMHKFLHLRQPLPGNKHPNPRVLQPGRCYEYPFLFVVPQHLLPQACTHDTVSSSITQAHLQLPPSLEDTSPGDFRISYAVRAVVSNVSDKGATKVLSKCTKKVRILPAAEKQLCMDPVLDNANICTRLEQDIKRGLEKHTKGHMSVEAAPANPVLRQPVSQGNKTNTTMMRVTLRFDPAVLDASPPQPKEISAKLHTHTFYATIPWRDRPSWTDNLLLAGRAQSAFTKKTKLGSFGVGPLQWTKHARDIDEISKTMSPDPSTNHLAGGGDIYYTTSFVLPISLPQSETQIPTFHSCLISRTYDLKIRITHNTSKSGSRTPDGVVKVPLNVFYRRDDSQEVPSTLKEDFFSDCVPCGFDSCDIKRSPPEYWI